MFSQESPWKQHHNYTIFDAECKGAMEKYPQFSILNICLLIWRVSIVGGSITTSLDENWRGEYQHLLYFGRIGIVSVLLNIYISLSFIYSGLSAHSSSHTYNNLYPNFSQDWVLLKCCPSLYLDPLIECQYSPLYSIANLISGITMSSSLPIKALSLDFKFGKYSRQNSMNSLSYLDVPWFLGKQLKHLGILSYSWPSMCLVLCIVDSNTLPHSWHFHLYVWNSPLYSVLSNIGIMYWFQPHIIFHALTYWMLLNPHLFNAFYSCFYISRPFGLPYFNVLVLAAFCLNSIVYVYACTPLYFSATVLRYEDKRCSCTSGLVIELTRNLCTHYSSPQVFPTNCFPFLFNFRTLPHITHRASVKSYSLLVFMNMFKSTWWNLFRCERKPSIVVNYLPQMWHL